MTHLITSRTDWDEAMIADIWGHIEDIGKNDLKLDYYPPQFEIVSSEQMLDAYSSIGMPVMYGHWSFGKSFLRNWQKYQKGRMGLALEMVLNTNPSIAYLMEDNSGIDQAMVMAHASCGHSFVFKQNYVFKEWTNAGSIVDYLLYAKNYIRDCEDKYGEDEVEAILDACHVLANHSVDKTARKHKKRLSEDQAYAESAKKDDERQLDMDIIIKTTSAKPDEEKPDDPDLDLVGDEENILYFVYKNAPNAPQWQREIARIVHKVHQYWYPQMQTKLLNEGMATFTHFYIMDELEKRGLISPDAFISFLASHSGVTYQATALNKHYDGSYNPYALGFAMLKEVRRVCTAPTKEDAEWFPELVGKDWRTEIKAAVSDYRDESFVEQYLTPKLMRDWNMFSVAFSKGKGVVSEISDDLGYRNMRWELAQQYAQIQHVPNITVKSARMRGDRMLTLEYHPYKGRTLHRGYVEKTLKHVKKLWGYQVELVAEPDSNGMTEVLCSV